ncbi:MAG: hypothetical protein NC311_01650 [Muribaculaceae bacterium]|nr:hypothetical protein [Muribaculaceae bacterium]
MVAWLRVLANPKVIKHAGVIISNPRVLGRFIKTPAGRRAAFKYASMAVNSRAVQDSINRFMTQNNDKLQDDTQYTAQSAEYAELQKRVAALESQLKQSRDNESELQTATFTLGRRVIEMQHLYADMQSVLQQIRMAQMARATTAHTR